MKPALRARWITIRVSWRVYHKLLLSSVSMVVLLSLSGPVRATETLKRTTAATVAAAQASISASQKAAAAGRQSRDSLSRTVQALQAQRDAQVAARSLARQNPITSDGYRVADGYTANSAESPDNPAAGNAADKILPGLVRDLTIAWQGAADPVQTTDGAGQVLVSIEQQQQKAILSWTSFNVGAKTTVDFIQPDSSSIALNRVTNSVAPSQILGNINANGSVYVINSRGIIFGGSSQVNTHALIASSLDVGSSNTTTQNRDNFFLNSGIAAPASGEASFSSTLTTAQIAAGQRDGDIRMDPGSIINANKDADGSPGFVYAFGGNVTNKGTISAPGGGQVLLAAARQVTLTPGTYTINGVNHTIRGSGVTINAPLNSTTPDPYLSGTGLVKNEGLIEAQQGNVILAGDNIDLGGMISADTSITRNSQIFVDAVSKVKMTGSISVLPFANGETLPLSNSTAQDSSSVQKFVPPSIEMSAYDVTLEPTAHIHAPGAKVAFTSLGISNGNFNLIPNLDRNVAPQQIHLKSRLDSEGKVVEAAEIDVSGLQGVELAAAYNIIAVQPRGTEFADYPLQKDGPLFGKTLYVDIRDTGTRSDGTTWVGTPLADVSGFVGLVGQSINQLLTSAGSVSFKTETPGPRTGSNNQPLPNPQVVLDQGTQINLRGGYVDFQAGFVPNTVLLGADGHKYAVTKADPNLNYVGVAGEFIVDHDRVGLKEVYRNSFAAGRAVFQPGYIEGGDAGSLSIETMNPAINGTLLFGSVSGDRQRVAGKAPKQGSIVLKTLASIVMGDLAKTPIPSDFYTSNGSDRVVLSPEQFSGYGLSSLSLTGNDFTLTAGSTLTLAPGGQFAARTYGAIDINGTITAPSGAISLKTDAYGLGLAGPLYAGTVLTHPATGQDAAASDIRIAATGKLDASGRWVNDFGASSDGMSGPGFINGGTIELLTNNSSKGDRFDTTGSILLAEGSLLDVSSGGYINQKGAQRRNAAGVLDGKGGNITLAVYQGTSFDAQKLGGPKTPEEGAFAQVRPNGEMRAFGFSSGGSLTIKTPGLIEISEDPASETVGLRVPASLLSDSGFASLSFHSVDPGQPVNPGRGLVSSSFTLKAQQTWILRQRNFSDLVSYLDRPTGSNIGAFAPLITLPDDLRTPVNLTVAADNILLDTGSKILADAAAKITLQSVNGLGSSALLLGEMTAHGGTVAINSNQIWLGSDSLIDLSGTFIGNSLLGLSSGFTQKGRLLAGGTLSIDTGITGSQTTGYIIADSGAVVDVSGAKGILTTTAGGGGGASGKVVAGGTEYWTDGGTVSINTRTLLWDGNFKAEAGDARGNRGTLIAGGSNIVLQQTTGNDANLNVSAKVAQLKSGLNLSSAAALKDINGSLADNTSRAGLSYDGAEILAVDKLTAFDTIYLTAGVGGQKYFSNGIVDSLSPLPLKLNGDVNLSVRNGLYIAASAIQPLTDTGVAAGNSTLQAPYIMLATGEIKSSALPAPGAGSLTIKAGAIDVRSAVLSGFAKTTLTSTGDIRLMTQAIVTNLADQALNRKPSVFFGAIISAGDLEFEAQRIYPISGVDFEIVSTSPTGTITFKAPANSDTTTPLSAGGSVTVAAKTIKQGGNLMAPLGKIQLGALTFADLSLNDPFRQNSNYFVRTQDVTLGANSLTTVSLNNTVVPFGQTEDGTNWFYAADTSPLANAPVKTIKLLGKDVAVDKQAVVDLSGGGDLQAIEFIPGKGGSRDVLSKGPDGKPVYALVPSRSDKTAGFDIDFALTLGDAQPLVGQQVHLEGVNGIPDGNYTIYPGHYATLPGALRLVEYGNTLSKPGYEGAVLPDGTQIVKGYYTQSLRPDARSAGDQLFAIQTAAVWRRYSEIASATAGSYFANKAQHDGVITPLLPIDGGRLAISAVNKLSLDAPARSLPGAGGRGGQLDISAAKIDLIGPGQEAEAGYTKIEVAQLNASGFESILIGGLRSEIATGTLITPAASSILVDTQGTAFTALEIILATTAPTKAISVNVVSATGSTTAVAITVPDASAGPTGDITVKSGSIIETKGAIEGAGRAYLIGAATPTNVKDAAELQQYAALASSGYGALLMLSNDPNVSVTRRNSFATVPETIKVGTTGSSVTLTPDQSLRNIGKLMIAADAVVHGGQRLVVEATAHEAAIAIDPAAILNAKSMSFAARSIGIGVNPAATNGMVLTPGLIDQISGTQNLTLRTLGGSINFDGTVDFNTAKSLRNVVLDTNGLIGGGADVKISAGETLTLVNSGAGAAFPFTALNGGKLTLDAAEIDLGGGDMNIAGFTAVDWNASDRVFAKASGSIKAGANADPVDLTITSPNLRVGAKTSTGASSQMAITTLGKVTLNRPAGASAAPDATDEIGGSLQLTGSSIVMQSTIQAVAGNVTLKATAGDVTLGDSALIAAGGYKQSLFDVDKYVPGGTVKLVSDLGDVITAATSTVDLSQPSGGLAAGGAFYVDALAGNATLDGALQAAGGPGLGGEFHLNTKGGADLDALAPKLALGGVTGVIDVHTRTGNLTLSQASLLNAYHVGLTADDASAGNGQITIDGTIDASGFSGKTPNGTRHAGGQVELYAHNAITLGSTGKILATTTHADERGGDVVLGLAAGAKGVIDRKPGSLIDVSGGSAGGLSGGTVRIRAPIQVGMNETAVATSSVAAKITGARSFTVEDFVTVTPEGLFGGGSFIVNGRTIVFDGIIDPAGRYDSNGNPMPAGTVNQDHIDLYQFLAQQFIQGKSEGLGFSDAETRLRSGLSADLNAVFHFQPGIELINNDPNVNHGNITIASNWNLAAGIAYDNSGNPLASGATFDPATNSIKFLYRYGLEPGALTLRAIGDIEVNASISDGFFQFRNYAAPAYQSAAANYVGNSSIVGRRIIGGGTAGFAYGLNSVTYRTLLGQLVARDIPVAPYDPSANLASPSTVALASADLFPHVLNVVDNRDTSNNSIRAVGMDSWSYRLTAGADAFSANPNAVGSMSLYGPSGHGNVVVGKNYDKQSDRPVDYTQFIQSSSGAVNPTPVPVYLPTMVRTGTGGIDVFAARDVILVDHFAPGVIYTAGRNTDLLPGANYTLKGTTPQTAVLEALNPSGFFEPQLLSYGNLTRPTGPLTAAAFPEQAGDIEIFAGQDIIGIQNVVLDNLPNPSGFGTQNDVPYHQLYAPWLLSMAQVKADNNALASATFGAGSFAPTGRNLAQQSAWWIQFGSFDQGVLSAGGNVAVTAGRDMRDFSVSLPSTGRVSGGLSATDTPVTHVYGSGNLSIQVGRDLYSGSFYEGSGHASITVGGSVRTTDWLRPPPGINPVPANTTSPVGTVLAVDSGRLELTALGSIAIANIVNPAELHAQTTNNTSGINTTPLFMDTYGPNSAIGLTSIGGDVTISSDLTLFNNNAVTTANTVAQTYPATFDVTALSGSIALPKDKVILSPSDRGALNLLAWNTLDLTGGRAKVPNSTPTIISAGESVLNLAFDSYRPNNGFDGDTIEARLAHADDAQGEQINHFYAVEGDILGNGRLVSPRPVAVRAGNDIIDFNLIAQNIRATDVSSVIAGHDLKYTGPANFGGLTIAGPGFFHVEAGRDLGPFVPAAFNTSTSLTGITSAGNATSSPVGNDTWQSGSSIGQQNRQFINKRNFLLSDEGATIIAMFGTAKGADYPAVISRYIDPANALTVPHNYLGELRGFLASLGIASADDNDAWTKFQSALTPQLRDFFVAKVFFAELQVAGDSTSDDFGKFQRGYAMVNTLFPAGLGYTENQLGGGSNGASTLIKTGDLDLLHATIQTQRGGDIFLMGPGGSILVGSTATEPNKKLSLKDLGIQTHDGGAIRSFTDKDVLVNQSRIFTVQGGDILLWSSNGDLNAGRGARTTASLPPLSIIIDNDNFQSIDPGGLVTGAGIAVLQTSDSAESSNAYLIAPRGTVDAGDAGIRVSGNLSIAAAFVANADNISVAGSSSGVPVAPSVNVGALSAASSTSAATGGTSETQTRPTANQNSLPSIITVEVLGFGEPSDEQKRKMSQ